jgi:antitoxin (DNA-binding transcriptional repressor) of toxin-antitoxin stability system
MSVTEAARNFSDCISRVRYQNAIFVLLKNGSPVARLAPENEKICTGRHLAEALAKVKLPDEEAEMWHKDLQAGRKSLTAPPAKWR